MQLKSIFGTGVKYSYPNEQSDRLVDNSIPIGVEIELENIDHNDILIKGWVNHSDGSLRNNGCEFVTGVQIYNNVLPLKGKDLVDALDVIYDHLTRFEPDAEVSERTSVHIHIDFSEFTVDELSTFIILYTIFEKVLFEYAGMNRYNNLYCSPITADAKLFQKISKSLYSHSLALVIQQACAKYSAMNLHSLTKLGTIEFRMHRGSTDTSKILEWINILLSLRQYSKVFHKDGGMFIRGQLDVLPHDISNKGVNAFLKEVFGEYASVLITHNTYDNLISGIRSAQTMIFYNEIVEFSSIYHKYLVNKVAELINKGTPNKYSSKVISAFYK